MFKLIKIVNSGVNVPEPCRLPKSKSAVIKMGAALLLNEGSATNCARTNFPKYIAMEDGVEGKDYVTAYQVTGNMIFETTVDADPSSLVIGDLVTLSTDASGATVCVSTITTSGVATIVSLEGATKAGDIITVKF